MKTRLAILFLLTIALPMQSIQAQSIPSACTQSWVRYGAVPDPNFSMFTSHFVWVLDRGGVADYRIYGNGDSVDILWGNRPGRFPIGIAEVSEAGCSGDTLWTFIDVRGSVLDIGPDKEVCYNDTFIFDAGSGFISYLWNNADTGRTFRGIARQSDTVFVVAINQYNCRSSDTAIVTVRPLPIVDISDMASGKPFNDTMICGNTTITLDAGTDGLFFTWNTGEITNSITVPAIDPASNDSIKYYTVFVENQYGCATTDSVALVRCIPPETKDIPNVFTPNGDGKNDVWRIPAFEFYPKAKVEVYDRWNRLVYRSSGANYKPWDGTTNGKEAPMGSYFYLITGVGKDIKGTVVIVR